MLESEVREIFLTIQNAYNHFDYDDNKVALWQTMLSDMPLALVVKNLHEYIKNSQFPPTIADLRKLPEQTTNGRHIPNVLETRQMLEQQEREWQALPTVKTSDFRKKVRTLAAYRSRHTDADSN